MTGQPLSIALRLRFKAVSKPLQRVAVVGRMMEAAHHG